MSCPYVDIKFVVPMYDDGGPNVLPVIPTGIMCVPTVYREIQLNQHDVIQLDFNAAQFLGTDLVWAAYQLLPNTYNAACVGFNVLMDAILDILSGENVDFKAIFSQLWMLVKRAAVADLRDATLLYLQKYYNIEKRTQGWVKVVRNPNSPYGFAIIITPRLSKTAKSRIRRQIIQFLYDKVGSIRVKKQKRRKNGGIKIFDEKANRTPQTAVGKAISNVQQKVETAINKEISYVVDTAEDFVIDKLIASARALEDQLAATPDDDYDDDEIHLDTPNVYEPANLSVVDAVSKALQDPLGVVYNVEFYTNNVVSAISSSTFINILSSSLVNNQNLNNLASIHGAGNLGLSVDKSSPNSNPELFGTISGGTNALDTQIQMYIDATTLFRGTIEKYLNVKDTDENDSESLLVNRIMAYDFAAQIVNNMNSYYVDLLAQDLKPKFLYANGLSQNLKNQLTISYYYYMLNAPLYDGYSVIPLYDAPGDNPDASSDAILLPFGVFSYLVNSMGERWVRKVFGDKIAIERINSDEFLQEFYEYVKYVMMQNDTNTLKQVASSLSLSSLYSDNTTSSNKPPRTLFEFFMQFIKTKYDSYEDYVDAKIEEVKNDINPYRFSITKHMIEQYDKTKDITTAERLFRLLTKAMLPIEGNDLHSIMFPVDNEIGKSERTNLLRDIMSGEHNNQGGRIASLLNPVTLLMAKNMDLLREYFMNEDIATSHYVIASLEPTTLYFEPLPARYVYDTFSDPEFVQFLKDRGFNVEDIESSRSYPYNRYISIFTDVLPLKSLEVSFSELETDTINMGAYRIEIPIKWEGVYIPNIRLEIYDNAYRDLYHYFNRYQKIAFYKGSARPPFDISFILDIIVMSPYGMIEDLVSYVVVPKNISMIYLDYDADEFLKEHTISIEFSVIGFLYYLGDNEVVSLPSTNDEDLGTYKHMTGSFVEHNRFERITGLNDINTQTQNILKYLANWYGTQPLMPLTILNDTDATTGNMANVIASSKDKSIARIYGSQMINTSLTNVYTSGLLETSRGAPYINTRGHYNPYSFVLKK